MSEHARAYWKLLDSVEDYLRYGERTGHEIPADVVLQEERTRGGSGSGTPRSAEPGQLASRTPSGRGRDLPSARAARGGERSHPGDGSAAAPSGPREVFSAAAGGDREVRARRLAMLEERVHACTRCPLHEGRMNAVPGQGVLDPLVMVIGEGPGADEDRRGLPFVGRAGQYLDKWLEAIGLDRATNAYISNIVKCRPPENRDPRPNESEACLPYLRDQIELIRPRAILSVGRIASGILIGTGSGIGSLRGRNVYYNGIPLIPTYHPSGVLRNPEYKRPVWEDLKRLRALLDALADGPDEPVAPRSDGADG